MAGTRWGLRRAYDAPADADGVRVLVDRLWPRGLAKADARIDRHAVDVAPSTELRQWYGHDQARFDEFVICVVNELEREEGLLGVGDELEEDLVALPMR